MDSNESDLGELRQIFQPKLGNIVSGVISGLLFIPAGIAMSRYFWFINVTKEGDEFVCNFILPGIGVVLTLCGFYFLIWMKRLASHSLSVFDRGFAYAWRGTTEIVLWSEIEKIQEIFTEEKLKLLKVPGAYISHIDRSFVVQRKDGKKFSFTVNNIGGMKRLGKIFEESRDRYNIPWEQIEV